MSSQASIFTPSATVQAGDAVANDYEMNVTGSRYEAAPQTVADGEVTGFQIDSQGRQIVIGPTADNSPFLYRPMGVSGAYRLAAPVYADGDVAVLRMDSSGRTYVTDDQVQTALAAINVLITAGNASLVAIDDNTDTLEAGVAAIDASVIAGNAILTTIDTSANAIEASVAGIDTSCNAIEASVAAIDTSANAIEASVGSLDTKTPALGQATMANSRPVVVASDQSAIPVKLVGKAIANAPVRNDYTSVNVTTAAYVQLVASMTAACTEIEIFDSSGQTLKLAIGAAASEVDQVFVFPGGNGRIPLAIAAGVRLSIRAVSASATVGEISLNFYG